jgi:GT2 family glycosyltransferase
VLSKGYVRKQVEFMDENPNVAITAGITSLTGKNLVLDLELIPGIVEHFSYRQPRTFIWKTDKMPGTGGATFRLKALKQVNGFNEKLTGVGEDGDVAQRIRTSGWLIRFNEAEFCELHRDMSSFKDLCDKYRWYGYGLEKTYRHNREVFIFSRMSPIAGLVTGVLYSIYAYKLLHQRMVFLLPIHYGIKMTAWMLGFIKGQIGL